MVVGQPGTSGLPAQYPVAEEIQQGLEDVQWMYPVIKSEVIIVLLMDQLTYNIKLVIRTIVLVRTFYLKYQLYIIIEWI